MADYEAPIVNGRVRLSPAATQRLTESGAMSSRAFLLDEYDNRSELPLVLGGSVTMEARSVVRASASFDILGRWSDVGTSRLTPYGNRVVLQRGIRIDPWSIEWVTLGTFRITSVAQTDEAAESSMNITAKDYGKYLADNRFDQTTITDPAKTAVQNITDYVLETLPDVVVIDLTGSTATGGRIDLQQDRAGGIEKLATALGAEAYFARDGSFIIEPQRSIDDDPRWGLSVGETGNIIAVARERTADRTYNRVLAKGETNDTSAEGTSTPVPWAAVAITDVDDPLRYGGPFGKVTRFYVSPVLKTTEQCETAAAAILEKARGRRYSMSFTTLVNPALDPGDVVFSQLSDGTVRRHIVDSVDHPLGPAASQSVETRTMDQLPDEQEQAAAT